MNISGNFSIKEITHNKTDQIDGNSTTLGRKKGVKVTGKYVGQMDFEREPSCVSAYHGPETPVSISPPVQRPCSSPAQQQECPKEKDNGAGGNCNRERGQGVVDANISKQTMEELKSLLQESSFLSVQGKEGGRPGSAYSYLQMTRPDGRPEEVRNLSFTTFKPQNESSQNPPRCWKGPTSLPTTTNADPAGACRADVSANSPSSFRNPIIECATWKDVMMSQAENGKDMNIDTQRSQTFSNYYLTTGHIKQKIAQEEVNLVRFEAADLHGVSRSKTVPAHVFQEKALYGVPMPRSYLELTLSPKNTEVDHGSASNFNSDVLLIPELPTFRVLPWASQTARVICDSCSVSGHPLRTSPRLIAKQLLGQLQSLGFSLHSSFSYECCVFSVPEKINSNALFFPAATLLNNHDLPFFQQMVSNMYYMGVEVDSFSSASRPGQMEISLQPEFGIGAADSAFTLRTGIKEMARNHGYIASFFADDGFYNSGVLSHSLWDVNGRKNLFHSGGGELSETGRKWLAGLLHHSASLNCMMAPGVSCRRQISKDIKDPKQTIYATCGFNDNSCAFNVKSHGGKGMHIDNKMGSAMANPYLVLATTVAAGLDGIKRNLTIDIGPTGTLTQPKQFPIPVKLEDALIALEEDHIIRGALGDSFVHYFMAMKRYEIETQEMDAERNKCLEYFI